MKYVSNRVFNNITFYEITHMVEAETKRIKQEAQAKIIAVMPEYANRKYK